MSGRASRSRSRCSASSASASDHAALFVAVTAVSSSDLAWSPRTLPTGADEAGGPPFKVLRAFGQTHEVASEVSYLRLEPRCTRRLRVRPPSALPSMRNGVRRADHYERRARRLL